MSTLTTTELTITLATAIAGVAYIAFILVPAVSAYTRIWEKIGAAFLTLFILATLVGVGAAMGLAIVWSYDTYA